MTHGIHITCMSSKRETALNLSQLDLGFIADNNSWNVNGKPQNCAADAQEY